MHGIERRMVVVAARVKLEVVALDPKHADAIVGVELRHRRGRIELVREDRAVHVRRRVLSGVNPQARRCTARIPCSPARPGYKLRIVAPSKHGVHVFAGLMDVARLMTARSADRVVAKQPRDRNGRPRRPPRPVRVHVGALPRGATRSREVTSYPATSASMNRGPSASRSSATASAAGIT
jgi:hypothetical protein